MTRMSQVIVEPDTIGPWIGLVGVVVGVAITAATDGLRARRKDRKERLRGNQAAADELLAAANALIVVRAMFDIAVSGEGLSGRADPAHEWVGLWMRQSERIQKASEKLVRYGPGDLAALGMKVAQAANVTPIDMKGNFPEEFENLLSGFATLMRTTLGWPGQATGAKLRKVQRGIHRGRPEPTVSNAGSHGPDGLPTGQMRMGDAGNVPTSPPP